MKKGSGSLDFGGDDSDDGTQEDTSEPPVQTPRNSDEQQDKIDAEKSEPQTDDSSDQQDQDFPYFVRRSKVGDERDERIEVHLRETVLEEESDFRSSLADALDESGEVSKTDAREFALKYAYENPEGVAELMREEGYGLVD